MKYAGGIGTLGLDSLMYINDVPPDYIPEDDSYLVVMIQEGYTRPHMN